MVKKVIWSGKAQKDRIAILEYWKNRTKSVQYSKKLDLLFRDAINSLKTHPNLGKPTSYDHVRVKIVREYLIFYEVITTELIILTIWDSRRDPKKLKLDD